MPRVFNKRAGRIDDPNAVYVGRPSKFGNPFVIGIHGDRAEVLAQFRRYLLARPDLLAAARDELRGRDLICWCAPAPCHADLLLEVANQED